MRSRDLLLLAVLQTLILLTVAAFQPGPGYMDAEYYAVVGRRLAQGQGATEPFLWNYLDDPQGIPHPAFAYWSPLSAVLVSVGLRLWTSGGYAAARLPFLALGILLPPLTALLTWRLTRRRALAWLAGGLALASGYYLPYWPVTETFTPTAFLGALLWLGLTAWDRGAEGAGERGEHKEAGDLLPSPKGRGAGGEGETPRRQGDAKGAKESTVGHSVMGRLLVRALPPSPGKEAGDLPLSPSGRGAGGEGAPPSPSGRGIGGLRRAPTRREGLLPFLLGLIVAGLHLTRNEGLLWLFVALGIVLTTSPKRQRGGAALAVLGGYLLGYAPRLAYNLHTWGRLSPPGVGRTLWLTTYNDLFAYPAAVLTPQRWLAQGGAGLGKAWAWAFRRNLLTLWAVQGQIVVLPFVFVGAWRLWHRPTTRWAVLGWLALGSTLSVVFPFAGARGGFFHAGAALQPLLWAWAVVGLEAALRAAARRRGWPWPQAGWVLGGGLLAVLALLSALIVAQRVLGPDPARPTWAASERVYVHLAQALAQRNDGALPPVLINNPPGWAWVTHDAPALVIPNGGPEVARAVALRYGVRWMILESNHPPALDDLYAHPRDRAGWRYVTTVDDARFFVLEASP